MNTLPGRLMYKNEAVFIIPRDPYGIFCRLATMVFSQQFSYDEMNPVDLFTHIESDWTSFESRLNTTRVSNFWFLRWIYQELPRDFWKYNVNIDVCKKEILHSSKSSREKFMFETWIDMPNKKNKIKKSLINKHLLEELQAKRLTLPSYDEIVVQVAGWGNDTRYCYGKIKDIQSNVQL